MTLTFLTLLVWSQAGLAIPKIIGGHHVPHQASQEEQHPGEFNTVALVKEDGKIFCSGSLIAENLVVTAKHCLMDKEGQKVRLYFGDNTEEEKVELYRDVVEYKVRHPKDWTMTFPSFDIAWVKFEGSLPKPFRPLPILANANALRPGAKIIQVGYGDHNPSVGQVDAGVKLWGETRLHRYINNPRFYHILLFHGEEGQGSCHGDSGGPAYVKVNGKWHIIGVTNGFDVVLTPMTMVRTGDPDFPYNVDCSKNQSLYSFVGAHGQWIEETSGLQVKKNDSFIHLDREETKKVSTVHEWCSRQDIGSPEWNLLKIILDKRVDEMPQGEAVNFYEDCDQITSYLNGLETISLDHETVMEGDLGFSPLALLPRLKKLALYNFPRKRLKLDSIQNLDLESLILKNIGLTNLRFFQRNRIKALSIEQNPLFDLSGLGTIENLEEITLSGTPIKDLSPLENFNIKRLYAVGINSPIVFGLSKIAPKLEVLDLRNTIVSSTKVISRMGNLKEISVTGDIGDLDLSNLFNLESINIKDFKEGQIKFPRSMPHLKKLSASQNEIKDIFFLARAPFVEEVNLTFNSIRNLEVFSTQSFDNLWSLNLSGNPLLNVSPLASIKSLELLRLFRTPLQSGLIPKTPENCPKDRGPEPLKSFCR